MAEDPVLLITGASSGIGAATARAAAGSHRLVLAARRADPVEELADELGGEERALAARCDVTEWEQLEAVVAAALGRFGAIDAVFANAGFGAQRGFMEETPEHWRSMVLTNVYGVALTIRATLPQMLERGDGHYLITSSLAGRRPLPGSLYGATKHAATAIGHGLRQELHQMHDDNAIRVTLIEPGMVDTEFFEAGAPDWALRDEDIARAALYALRQPDRVEINEVLVLPTGQPG